MCKEAEVEDSGPIPRNQPSGCGSEREQEEKENRRRGKRRKSADAGVSKWPPGEKESGQGGEEEITQPVLFSYPPPWQVKRLSVTTLQLQPLLLSVRGNVRSGSLKNRNIA